MLPKYRDHGQVLCITCGHAGLINADSEYTGSDTRFGYCERCKRWIAYILDEGAIIPGDIVWVVDKDYAPEIGSYTSLEDTSWDVGDIGIVIKITSRGGILLGRLGYDYNRIGVFPDWNLERISDASDGNEYFDWDTLEEPSPIEWEYLEPTPWYKKFFNYLMDKIFGVF